MKKIVCFVVALLVAMPALSLAEIDLASMSFDELIELKTQILEELVSRPEAKEVNVPAGDYIVGEDIPAGNYTVYSASSASMLGVNDYETMHVLSENDYIGKLVLKDGDQVNIVGSCIFTAYKGLDF